MPVVEGPPQPWDDMAYAERKSYMMRTVRPTMAKLFRAYDPVEFANFGCHTCHGEDLNERHHEMPNALPLLWPTGTPEQRQTVDNHPKMVKFMFNRVRPTMRDLLGLQDYDPEAGEGFGCFSCHPRGDAQGPGGTEEPPPADAMPPPSEMPPLTDMPSPVDP